MAYSLPGSSTRGIFQARVLEWVPISFSRGSSHPRDPIPSHLPHCRQMLYPLSHQGSQSANWYSYYSYNCILIAFQILWHYSIEEGRVYAPFPWTWVGLWLLWPIEFRKDIIDFVCVCVWYSCLHYCVDFCCTMTWISYMCTYIPSLLDFQPNTPSHPPRSAQGTKMSFLCYNTGSH